MRAFPSRFAVRERALLSARPLRDGSALLREHCSTLESVAEASGAGLRPN